MGLQTDRLTMLGLGVVGDSPPTELQPTLTDGIHLRWSFRPEAGFPWHGYFLFRREHREGKPVRLAEQLTGRTPGQLQGTVLDTPAGMISSDRPLRLTEDFEPAGQVEVDLAERRSVRVDLPAGVTAWLVEVTVGLREQVGTTGGPELVVTGYAAADTADTAVATAHLAGEPKSVVTVRLRADAITAVEVGPGPAALVDVAYYRVADGAADGWQGVDTIGQPIGLPVRHPNYPATGNLAVNEAAASATGLGRIRYTDPSEFAGAPFHDLHTQLLNLVGGGPSGPPMATRTLPDATGVPTTPTSGVAAPTVRGPSTLGMLLFAALHPAFAQLLGIYAVDTAAKEGVRYDYLVVADHTGIARGSAARLPPLLRTQGFGAVDAWIAFDLRAERAAPLEPPASARVYALPGGTRRAPGGQAVDASGNAGLRWATADTTTVDTSTTDTTTTAEAAPDAAATAAAPVTATTSTLSTSTLSTLSRGPVLFHVWRAALGDDEKPKEIGPDTLEPVTKNGPVLVSRTPAALALQVSRPADWPPFPLHFVDTGLAEGWYAYAVSGVDVFGRHSAASEPASWYQWAPEPRPRPWYYRDPPGEAPVHPNAVRVLDLVPPPAPTAVAATALDHADSALRRDAAFESWVASLGPAEKESVAGLRVSWEWTPAQARQAPDLAEFRIYVRPGQFGSRRLQVTQTEVADPATSLVTTDVPTPVGVPGGAWAGAVLRQQDRSFPVVVAQPGSAGAPLTLRVRHLGLTHTAGTVTAGPGSPIVDGVGTGWHPGLAGLSFSPTGTGMALTVVEVTSPTRLVLAARWPGTPVTAGGYEIFDARPAAGVPATLVIPETRGAGTVTLTPGSAVVDGTGTGTGWDASLAGQWFTAVGRSPRLRVAAVTAPTRLVLASAWPGPAGAGGTGLAYAITHPLVVDPADAASWADRFHVVRAHENVTVIPVEGGQLRRYDVLLPAPGAAFRGGLPLATSTIDPVAYAQVGVSAADSRPHADDHPKWSSGRWGGRPGNESRVAGPATVVRVHRVPPVSPAGPPDAERVLASPADYAGRSFHTVRWVPAPGVRVHVLRALDQVVFAADRHRIGVASLDPAAPGVFPSGGRWTPALRAQVAGEINAARALAPAERDAAYRALSDDALRVLAGLPGNERAFTQVTIVPLDPGDPANANRLGPDDPTGTPVDPALRAWVDALDGKAAGNRYLYRLVALDGAYNTGPPGPVHPPVVAPRVVPPRTPRLTGAAGADRAIILRWASNRDRDLAGYRVYRALAPADAEDTRLMALVHTEAVAGPASTDPFARPAEVTWTDTTAPTRVPVFYRLVAVDSAGNPSRPTQALTAQAFDETRPEPPIWLPSVAGPGPNELVLSWASPDPALRCIVQRRVGAATTWDTVSGWLPRGIYTFTDPDHVPGLAYTYRLRVMDTAGRTNSDHIELTAELTN